MKPLFVSALCVSLLVGCETGGVDPQDGGSVDPGVDAGVDAKVDSGSPAPDAAFEDTGVRPTGRFLEIWNDLSAQAGPLGYPFANALEGVICAWQPFERGVMIWLENRSIASGCQEFCEDPRIFTLIGGSTSVSSGSPFYDHPDLFMEGDEAFACEEANRETADRLGTPAPIGPVRGFGRVWCESPLVMDGLGAATAPERGGGTYQSCRTQLFQGGIMIHNPNDEHRSYWVLLRRDQTWRRYDE